MEEVPQVNEDLSQQRIDREGAFEIFFESLIRNQGSILMLSTASLSRSVDIVLQALSLDQGLVVTKPHIVCKACYCLSLIAFLRPDDGALDMVNKGGVAAVVNLMKAFPEDEVIQVGCFVTISQVASQMSDKNHFEPLAECVLSAFQLFPFSSEVYEAACLVIVAVNANIINLIPFNKCELVTGSIVCGLNIHGHDDKAHFAGRRAIECLMCQDPSLAKRIVQQAELRQNPGAAAWYLLE